jgi:hypothetical protein
MWDWLDRFKPRLERFSRRHDYQRAAKSIPWAYLGRDTVARGVGHCLHPLGIFSKPPPQRHSEPSRRRFTSHDPDFEQYLMNIVGTGIQVAPDKLVSCLHVMAGITSTNQTGFVLIRLEYDQGVVLYHYPYSGHVKYRDPRTNKTNTDVDVALIPFRTRSPLPRLPHIRWGKSEDLGVGDTVVIGGYAYGTDLFRMTRSNRGLVQPTFYQGIVSGILPAMKQRETRLIQIAVATAGGMSGGAVFEPRSGRVVGMVTSGIDGLNGAPHPVTYALPSEIIRPFVDAADVLWKPRSGSEECS